MGINKVEQDYINGIPAMNNLIAMIETAIKNTEIPFIEDRDPEDGTTGDSICSRTENSGAVYIIVNI